MWMHSQAQRSPTLRTPQTLVLVEHMILGCHKHPLKILPIFGKYNTMQTVNMAIFQCHTLNKGVLFGKMSVPVLIHNKRIYYHLFYGDF